MESNFTIEPKPKPVKEFFKSRRFWKPLLGITIGGLAGFWFYFFVGCTSGTCPITSNPYASIIIGGVLGFLLTS